MHLNIVICTWNRAALLDQTLAKMTALVTPTDTTWDVLVVDNNCTDTTAEVVKTYESKLPIRRVLETKQGHSNARNRGVDESSGDYLIWTDDDVLVEPNWLVEYAAAFRRHPEAGYFGGYIEPWFEAEPPAWVTANLEVLQGLLVIRNLGPEERLFANTEEPFGANMAFRMPVQKEFRYNPNLGKQKNRTILADETDLFRRVTNAGHKGYWVPTARMKHYVSKNRTELNYLREYFHGLGKTLVRFENMTSDSATLFGAPRWLLAKKWKMQAKAQWQRVTGQRDWVLPYTKALYYQGMIDELKARALPPAVTQEVPA